MAQTGGCRALDEGDDQPLRTHPSRAEDRAVGRATARRVRADSQRLAADARRVRAEGRSEWDLAVAALAELDDLRRAMQTRSLIDMAKGALMAVHGCDESEAFALLRAASQREHRKLRDVAAQVLATIAENPSPEGASLSLTSWGD